MEHLPSGGGTHADARARREQYYVLRRQGTGPREAASQLGIFEMSTRNKYERWWQAVQRGESPERGQQGGRGRR